MTKEEKDEQRRRELKAKFDEVRKIAVILVDLALNEVKAPEQLQPVIFDITQTYINDIKAKVLEVVLQDIHPVKKSLDLLQETMLITEGYHAKIHRIVQFYRDKSLVDMKHAGGLH